MMVKWRIFERSHREVSKLSHFHFHWKLANLTIPPKTEQWKQGFSTLLGDGKISLLNYLEAIIFSSHVWEGRRSSLWKLVMRDSFGLSLAQEFLSPSVGPQCWGDLPWRKYVADDAWDRISAWFESVWVHSDFSTLYIHLYDLHILEKREAMENIFRIQECFSSCRISIKICIVSEPLSRFLMLLSILFQWGGAIPCRWQWHQRWLVCSDWSSF